jgi:hypothetical protein
VVVEGISAQRQMGADQGIPVSFRGFTLSREVFALDVNESGRMFICDIFRTIHTA